MGIVGFHWGVKGGDLGGKLDGLCFWGFGGQEWLFSQNVNVFTNSRLLYTQMLLTRYDSKTARFAVQDLTVFYIV